MKNFILNTKYQIPNTKKFIYKLTLFLTFLNVLLPYFAFLQPKPAYAGTQTIGEAGTKGSLNGAEWLSVSLTSSYYDSTPLVFQTTQTTGGGQDPSCPHARNVTTSGFDTQHCEYDSYSCDSHNAETNGWLTLDPAKVQNTKGMDGGTTTISGNNTVTVNFNKTFTNTPLVFAQVTTNNGQLPINAKVISKTTSSVDIELCEQNATDGCDTGHTTETVAWLAIDPQEADKLTSWDWGTVTVGDSNWNSVSYSFGSTPVVIVETQTQNGGQEDLIPEADSVTSTGASIRYCEAQGTNSCDTHANETVAWLAVLPGDVEGTRLGCRTSSGTISIVCSWTNDLGTDSDNLDHTIRGVHETSGTANISSISIASGVTVTVGAYDTIVVGSIDLSGSSGSIALVDGGIIKPGGTLWHTDNDGDGYAPNSNVKVSESVTGMVHESSVTGTSDCNDSDGSKYQNLTGYTDNDNDSHGTGTSSQICSGASLPSGYSNDSCDIDDNNDCADCSTTHQCGDGGTDGTCSPLSAGEHGRPTCERCDGTSTDIAYFADGNQDNEGSDLCNQPCKTCDGNGSCDGDNISYGGQTYSTLSIGSQCWLGENLNVTNGNTDQSCSITRYCYADNSSNCNTYGGLYTWNDAMCGSTTNGAQGICPNGWHVPTDSELTTLEDNVCGDAGDEGSALAGNASLWTVDTLEADNDFDCSGFDLLPGGDRYTDGSYYHLGNRTLLWSSTEPDSSVAWLRYVDYRGPVFRSYYVKGYGLSVRCLKD